jgi:hypothetical protein
MFSDLAVEIGSGCPRPTLLPKAPLGRTIFEIASHPHPLSPSFRSSAFAGWRVAILFAVSNFSSFQALLGKVLSNHKERRTPSANTVICDSEFAPKSVPSPSRRGKRKRQKQYRSAAIVEQAWNFTRFHCRSAYELNRILVFCTQTLQQIVLVPRMLITAINLHSHRGRVKFLLQHDETQHPQKNSTPMVNCTVHKKARLLQMICK